MMQRAAVTLFLGVFLFASVASAHSTLKCDHPSAPTSSAPGLQQILDGLVVSGPQIDASAPIDIELWLNSAGPMTAQVVADYTGKSTAISFGMYDPDDPGNHAFLLPNGVTPADVSTVVFNDDQSISIRGPINGSDSPFEGPFGFFVKVWEDGKGGKHHGHGWGWGKHKGDDWGHHHEGKGKGSKVKEFFYTQDLLNPGGAARAIVFQGDGQTVLKLPGLAPGLFLPSQFLIAWETGLGDANDGEFNDFLVLVSNIVPATVPEPSFAFLLGISALAVVCGRSARSTK